jgi:hypothetical protein
MSFHWKEDWGVDKKQVEVIATCKADATARNDGKIDLYVEAHTRPSRTKLTLQVSAVIGPNPDLASLVELCSKLKKDRPTTLLVTPGPDAGQITVNEILLESLRLTVESGDKV